MSFIDFSVYFIIMVCILGIKTNLMSYIKDFNNLPISVKAIVLSIFAFFPFWFIILYYYFPNIMQLGWYEKLMFVAVPVIIWYLIEMGICKFLIPLAEIVSESKTTELQFWAIAFGRAILYLFVLFLIAYYTKITFELFCWIAFGYKAFEFFATLIIYVNNKDD